MRNFLIFLIFLPILVFGGTFAWVAKQEIKLQKSLAVPPPPIGLEPQTDDPAAKRGWQIFNAKGCVFCHGSNGAGGVKHPNAIGGEIPSLTKVAEGYSDDELKQKILNGVKEINKEDPNGPTPPLYMPVWKGHITDSELEDLVAFLKSLLPKESKEEW